MQKNRLEAFSDGVLAIIITIMVLEIKVPHGATLDALSPLLPVFVSYILSFTYVGIYWNNHHHMLHAAKRVSGGVLWANLHLLFWLSLLPFASGWMGENHFAPTPAALYGFVLLMCGFAYWLLARAIIKTDGPDSILAKAIGSDRKGNASLIFYLIAIPATLLSEWIAQVIYIGVALMWLIPDPRVEKALAESSKEH